MTTIEFASLVWLGSFLAGFLGSLTGAFLATRVPTAALAVIFGIVLGCSALSSVWGHRETHAGAPPDPLATRLKLNGTYPTAAGETPYQVYRVPAGFSLIYGAGVLSGLLGIGSGAIKVLAMDRAMRIPFKVSTTTSNFMIGVTGFGNLRGLSFEIGAGQVIQQHVEPRRKQILPALPQMHEQIPLVRQQPVQAAIEPIFFGRRMPAGAAVASGSASPARCRGPRPAPPGRPGTGSWL